MLTLILLFKLVNSNKIDEFIRENRNGVPCDLFMAESSIRGLGLGIFSGKKREHGSIIEENPTLTIQRSYLLNWSANNFVYESSIPSRSLFLFGSALMFNHVDDEHRNTKHHCKLCKLFSQVLIIMIIIIRVILCCIQ